MKNFLNHVVNAGPRGPMDVLAVILIVAFFACVIAFTVSSVRRARGR